MISDDSMRERLAKTKPYAVVLLRSGPNATDPDAARIIWEHGRRNFALREAGKLCIVCPVSGGGEIRGVGIFDGDVNEVRALMDGDPAIEAGVLVYDVHPLREFPRRRAALAPSV